MSLDTTTGNKKYDLKQQALEIAKKNNADFFGTKQLLEIINTNFPYDDANFLLTILIEKYPDILSSYWLNYIEENDKKIIEEIKKIQEENTNIMTNFSKTDEQETSELIKKQLEYTEKVKLFIENTYFQRYNFFKKLPSKLQNELLESLEGKSKKEIQQYVLEFEEKFEKNPIIKTLKEIWEKMKKTLDFKEEDLKPLEEKLNKI